MTMSLMSLMSYFLMRLKAALPVIAKLENPGVSAVTVFAAASTTDVRATQAPPVYL